MKLHFILALLLLPASAMEMNEDDLSIVLNSMEKITEKVEKLAELLQIEEKCYGFQCPITIKKFRFFESKKSRLIDLLEDIKEARTSKEVSSFDPEYNIKIIAERAWLPMRLEREAKMAQKKEYPMSESISDIKPLIFSISYPEIFLNTLLYVEKAEVTNQVINNVPIELINNVPIELMIREFTDTLLEKIGSTNLYIKSLTISGFCDSTLNSKHVENLFSKKIPNRLAYLALPEYTPVQAWDIIAKISFPKLCSFPKYMPFPAIGKLKPSTEISTGIPSWCNLNEVNIADVANGVKLIDPNIFCFKPFDNLETISFYNSTVGNWSLGDDRKKDLNETFLSNIFYLKTLKELSINGFEYLNHFLKDARSIAEADLFPHLGFEKSEKSKKSGETDALSCFGSEKSKKSEELCLPRLPEEIVRRIAAFLPASYPPCSSLRSLSFYPDMFSIRGGYMNSSRNGLRQNNTDPITSFSGVASLLWTMPKLETLKLLLEWSNNSINSMKYLGSAFKKMVELKELTLVLNGAFGVTFISLKDMVPVFEKLPNKLTSLTLKLLNCEPPTFQPEEKSFAFNGSENMMKALGNMTNLKYLSLDLSEKLENSKNFVDSLKKLGNLKTLQLDVFNSCEEDMENLASAFKNNQLVGNSLGKVSYICFKNIPTTISQNLDISENTKKDLRSKGFSLEFRSN